MFRWISCALGFAFLVLMPLPALAQADTKPPEGRWFTGMNVFPLATDETFGAGFMTGWARDWYVFTLRENFLTSANRRASDTALERVQRRFSFELTAEGLLRWGAVAFYGGPGVAFRDDRLVRLELLNGRFSEDDRNEGRLRPVLSLGFAGKLVEASVSVFFDDEPDVRFGIGISTGR